jgi:hypothetical protein
MCHGQRNELFPVYEGAPTDAMILDKSNPRVSWALYYFHNRKHDGEVWLAFQTPTGLLLMEQSDKWPDPEVSVLVGEIESQIVNGVFVDRIIPLREKSAEELRERARQTTEHKAYRKRLYQQYSIKERLKDLGASS